MNIDIYTALAQNSKNYAQYLQKNMIERSSHKHNLRFYTLGTINFKTEPIPGWEHLGNYRVPKYYRPSASHATILNKIIDHIPEDSHYIIIVDCDIAIIQKNWDLNMIAYLTKFNCVDTPKFSGTFGVFFCMFKTELYKRLKPDFMPGTRENGYLTTLSTNDTGYLVGKKLRGIKYLTYQQIDDAVLNYNYLYNNKLFITHMSGSRKFDYHGDRATMWRSHVEHAIIETKQSHRR